VNSPGRIGDYPIEREIGRGGMGIVYLGRDSRLDRPVAIKVLPEAFARDPERLARFEREARLLASLTHPNIAAIHGLEESSGQRFLVLEYVEGETLGERLARGPLPVDETIEVCRQIAAALEAAHDSGVIHRDLKPGNVKLTPAGEVKVLDFGLARGSAGSGSASDPELSASPTQALSAMTGAGVILGTAAYMSPEQARGRVVDRRTDIWSFGCVAYECLTGRQAFAGETVSDMIALILQGEPDWKALPAKMPPALRLLIERCLTKDPKKRLRDIGEARLMLEGGATSSISGIGLTAAADGAGAAAAGRRSARLPWTIAAVALLAAAALAAMGALKRPEPEPVMRLSVPVPAIPSFEREAALLALSPDGRTLVACAADSAGGFHLVLRPLDGVESRRLAGTEDGISPFWSPDGRYVAFFTQDKLLKLDLRGGRPEVLCPVASYGRGGSWGTRGVIVFTAGAEGPIFKVSENGGTPERVTTLDSAETGHRFPHFLPDGRHFLYAAMPPRQLQHSIFIGSIDSPRSERLEIAAESSPFYVEPGYLLYDRNGRIVAHRFDAARRRLIGEPVALLDEPERTDFVGSPNFSAGIRGALGYFRSQPVLAQLAWIDLASRSVERLRVPAGWYGNPALSPDGSRLILSRQTSPSASDLWLVDLARGTSSRFTFGPGRVDRPVWSPDGTRIAYASDRNGRWDIFEKVVGSTGPETPIVASGSLLKYPNAYTPDGRSLVFEQIGERTGWDLWIASLGGDRALRPLVATAYDESFSSLTQDGRWLAFQSNEAGRSEIYVQDFPGGTLRHQISHEGGISPAWRADGRAIAYIAANNRANVVEVNPATGFASGPIRSLPRRDDVITGTFDGDLRRALAVMGIEGAAVGHDLTLVLGWRSELKRR